MKDYTQIGSAPWEEDCVQIGSENYYERAVKECYKFMDMLIDKYYNKPKGAKFVVKTFPHDFGSYPEVCVVFDDEDNDASQFAYWLEDNLPATWDDTCPVDYIKAYQAQMEEGMDILDEVYEPVYDHPECYDCYWKGVDCEGRPESSTEGQYRCFKDKYEARKKEIEGY